MSKDKLKITNTVEVCPVVFRWGTFCRAVLSDQTDRTIQTVVPGLKIVIPKSMNQDLPAKILLPIGQLAFYALLERTQGINDKIDLDITAELNLPSAQSQQLKVALGDEHNHFQLGIRFEGAAIPIQTDKHQQDLCLICTLKYGNSVLGEVSMAISVSILNNEQEI